MKELTTDEVNKLSHEDLLKYLNERTVYLWSRKTDEEKDRDILSGQEFYANRRGVEGMNLEEELDIILNPDSSPEKLGKSFGNKFSERVISHQKNVQIGEKFTFFWITKSPFSQWHKIAFTATTILNEGISDILEQKKKHIVHNLFPLDEQEYSSAEQFMMYHKAMIFLDREIAKQIMQTDDVRKIKELGRQVKNYDEYVWKYFRSKVVYEGNKAKFTQNEDLKQALFATKGTTLVEAAPNDTIWGIGLAEDDPRALKRETWLGKNLLGEILTEIRIDLMGEY
ncbi:MAG: NADAR family protein [Bacteroidia bacterium]